MFYDTCHTKLKHLDISLETSPPSFTSQNKPTQLKL